MRIRTRLTLWYAAVMFVSAMAMGVLTYYQFAPEPAEQGTRAEERDEDEFRETLATILWCSVPAALLAMCGGWFLMRRAFEPVAALTVAAERADESNLTRQLPRSGNGDELDRLTEVFNAMTARLDASFQRVREFTLHASHELKTPLTVIHGELETSLQEESLSVSQRERLLSQLDEIQRLSKIVDGLALLTKADAGQVKLSEEPVRLDELVRDIFDDAQILAQASGLGLKLTECQAATVQGDRHRLRQLLLNLADNAVKYNQPQGHVTMTLKHDDKTAEFVISNTGPGIASEVLPRVFDRFFRGDPAHGRADESCGLGLSIAQWIVSAHKGTIEIESVPLKMTTVTVRLPLIEMRKTS